MVFDTTTFLPSRSVSRYYAASTLAEPETPASFLFSNVRWSHRSPPAPRARRGVKRLGIAYERRVLDVLTAIYGWSFKPSPIIDYTDQDGRPTFAIPDGVLWVDGWVIVIEVKLAHTANVWPQLMDKYLPLVKMLEPRTRIRTVEVCRSYDPGVLLPGPHTLIGSLHRDGRGLEVLQWKI